MNAALDLARYLVRIDYPDDEVIEAVREQFPDAEDVDGVVATARTEKTQEDAQLEQDLDHEARAAEFNLDIGGPS